MTADRWASVTSQTSTAVVGWRFTLHSVTSPKTGRVAPLELKSTMKGLKGDNQWWVFTSSDHGRKMRIIFNT